MKHWDCVAIVGVGLIGGSIGLALRNRGLAKQVIGIGRDTATLQQAMQSGAVTRTTTDLNEGVAAADLVIVCTPVESIVRYVRQAAAACPAGALLTDAGSTKAEIVNALASGLPVGVSYIGSHPIAGSEKTGAAHATADLFEGRTVVLTPTEQSPADKVDQLRNFWSSLGATVHVMTPEAHDAALAASSHLPHLVAASLAGATELDVLPLTAGGWRDTTRVAAGSPELWTQIIGQNRTNILASLARFEESLSALRSALETKDDRRLTELLTEAKRVRDAVGS